jgi:hypothetical protein
MQAQAVMERNAMTDLDVPERDAVTEGNPIRRALKRALVLFLILAAVVVVIALSTDGVPHLPFDYAGFD